MKKLEFYIYLFGQMYARLADKRKYLKWEEQSTLSSASRRPFSIFTKMYAEHIHDITKEDEEYIRVRMNDVPIEIYDSEPIAFNYQPMFTFGRYKANQSVKQLIDSCGLTQQEIADRLGVNRMTINRWYNTGKCSETMKYELEKLSINIEED